LTSLAVLRDDLHKMKVIMIIMFYFDFSYSVIVLLAGDGVPCPPKFTVVVLLFVLSSALLRLISQKDTFAYLVTGSRVLSLTMMEK
jgi:hypothetical protein